MTTSKDIYRHLCLNEPSIPIFSKDWWLDAVCGDAWDVSLVKKDGKIVAAMPYHIRRNRLGMNIISQPKETQTLGPWLRPSQAKYAKKLGQEKALLSELINQLPEFSYFHQNWHFSNTNWLPFYWQGFQQSTYYTYRLPDLTNLDAVWTGFRENIRTDIRKAYNRFNIKIRTDLDIDDFLALNAKTFDRQGKHPPYSPEFIRLLDQACQANSARRIFIAEDDQGNHHAGAYIIWDEQSAYYLMGGGNPVLRSSGATSLCMWEAIQFSASVTKSFDFEGSMNEPVERFFRAFGAVQTPYFSIKKTPSRLIKLRRYMSDLVR